MSTTYKQLAMAKGTTLYADNVERGFMTKTLFEIKSVQTKRLKPAPYNPKQQSGRSPLG